MTNEPTTKPPVIYLTEKTILELLHLRQEFEIKESLSVSNHYTQRSQFHTSGIDPLLFESFSR